MNVYQIGKNLIYAQQCRKIYLLTPLRTDILVSGNDVKVF